MNEIRMVLIHADIHRKGEGCCCPSHDVFCPLCPQHKGQDAIGQKIQALEQQLAEARAERDRFGDELTRLIDAHELTMHRLADAMDELGKKGEHQP